MVTLSEVNLKKDLVILIKHREPHSPTALMEGGVQSDHMVRWYREGLLTSCHGYLLPTVTVVVADVVVELKVPAQLEVLQSYMRGMPSPILIIIFNPPIPTPTPIAEILDPPHHHITMEWNGARGVNTSSDWPGSNDYIHVCRHGIRWCCTCVLFCCHGASCVGLPDSDCT